MREFGSEELVGSDGAGVGVRKAAMGSEEVVEQEVACRLVQQFAFGGDGFVLVELVFNTAVKVLHRAIEARGGHGDSAVGDPIALLQKLHEGTGLFGIGGADEFGAPVALHGSAFEGDSVATEVFQHQGGKAHGVFDGQLIGEADEGEAGDDVAQRVLVLGQ